MSETTSSETPEPTGTEVDYVAQMDAYLENVTEEDIAEGKRLMDLL